MCFSRSARARVCVYVCHRWFDKGEDDGAIERDLYPSNSIVDGVSWRLTVVTGVCVCVCVLGVGGLLFCTL